MHFMHRPFALTDISHTRGHCTAYSICSHVQLVVYYIIDAYNMKRQDKISEAGRECKVFDNILHTIGNTPLVRLNKVPRDYGLECDMYAKCEFLNPGGSIKDRISYTMMQEAENTGKAKSGSRFVVPTSGNTGIGIALATAVGGYGCTIVTPDKNSDEKISTIRLLGSEVVQTPTLTAWDGPDSFMSVAKKILNDDPNTISLDQYSSEINPQTHYEHTAEEILTALGDIDMVVIGSGTGGTVTGVGRKMKERCPKCVVVTVDPKGSVIFDDGLQELQLFYVEGIGGDFVPNVLDKTVIDRVEKPDDYQSFNMAREVIKKEGLLCGGSSGATMFAAISAAKALKLGAGKRVVVILADGIRNYMTKFVSDQWMEANLFKKPPEHDFKWWNQSISNLKVLKVPIIKENVPCVDALAAMGSEHNTAIIVNDDGFLQGVISKDSLRYEATNPKREVNINLREPVNKHFMKKYHKIVDNKGNPTIGLASRILDIVPFVVIAEEYYVNNRENPLRHYRPKGIITPDIMLDYIISHQ